MSEIPTAPEEEQQPLTGRQALLYEIGEKLSQSRAASGETIEKAVRKLKIRKSHLLALEHGNWDNMPDDIYVLGFLRQYSQYLGVDLSDELHRLKNDQYALTKPLTFPDPPVAPSRRWAWLTGAAFVLLFILFNIASENPHMDRQPDISKASAPATPADIPDDTATNTASSVPAKDIDSPVEHTSAPVTLPPSDKKPVSSPTKTDLAVTDAATAATTADEESIALKQPADESKPVPPHKSTTAVQIPNANAAMHRFRFDAVGSPVWLQISRPARSGNGKGSLIKEVLLQPGFHTTIHVRSDALWITCGNAPALRISVDGRVFAAAGSLGTGKKVLRDYRLNIDHHN